MYGYGYPYGFYFDPTYVLLIIGMILALAASGKMKSTFARYQQVRSHSGLTGAQTAQRILNAAGIYDVTVVPIAGSLTDHYDPRTKKLALSQDVYGRTSVAAVCVAAHECGHAIQHNVNYAPLNIRSAIVPVANIGSSLSWPIFPFWGLILSIPASYHSRNCACFSLAVLFQLVTLPVEFNASSRALKMLEKYRNSKSRGKCRCKKGAYRSSPDLCSSAGFLHFAALRLIILSGGRRRDD